MNGMVIREEALPSMLVENASSTDILSDRQASPVAMHITTLLMLLNSASSGVACIFGSLMLVVNSSLYCPNICCVVGVLALWCGESWM